VKKSLYLLAGVATLTAVICTGGRLHAQGNGVTPVRATTPSGTPAAKSKIAILNLKYVITNYSRFKTFQEENKKSYEKYEVQLKPLTTKMEGYSKQVKDPAVDQATKEKISKEAKQLQQQIQNITEEAREALGKQESDQLVLIYKEVGAAVSAYAVANDLELVMHYSDGTNEVEMNSPQNMHQKMGQRALIPLYWGQGTDISYPVLQNLNARAASAGAGAAAPR
jgi:Skp family chaperone for outer membrane proteins